MKHFVVFGNPISHSRSPRIHQLFAVQTGQQIDYQTYLGGIEAFEQELAQFFSGGGNGANITTPFKERAYHFCDQLSDAAKAAKAVNTIKPFAGGKLFGDNTDGIGLVTDLQRLQMLKPRTRVLLVGAGGAARGAILPLLEQHCQLVITNRTYQRAERVAQEFSHYGAIQACELNRLSGQPFDLIINATAAGIGGAIPDLPAGLINPAVACYDMFYLPRLTPFLSWAQGQSAESIADGLGMLVNQAAHAFYLWLGVMPDTVPVLTQLRQELGQ